MFRNKRLALSFLVVSMVSGSSALAEQKELTIYNVASMSGAFANFGKQAEKGARLAVETAGQAAGMKLKLVTIDTESNAGKAARKVKAVTGKEKGALFVGSTLSSTALAVGKEVHAAGGVYINGSGADEITGKECNASMYRWSAPTYGAVNASLQPVLDKHPEIKKVYAITPQYVFGDAMLDNAKKVLEARGIKLVGNSYHSLKEKEFSGYIAQAQAAKPDLLLLLNFGSLATNSIQQAVNFGLKDKMKILLVWSNGLDHLKTLGNEVVDGIYFGAQYWHQEDSIANKELLKLSAEKFNETPNYPMASYYQMTKTLIDAVNATGGADAEKIRAYMDGLEYDGITGQEIVRKEDHQVEKYFYLLEGKSKEKMSDGDDLADVVEKNKYFLPHEETGCVAIAQR
ncbi:MAG: ABC transporter substrate-binding protein [Arenicella sp.]